MRLALLSDIHGNLGALEAVLSDGTSMGVDAYAFLGDLVFFGLQPQACFDALLERSPLLCIKGNTDANLEEASTFHPSSAFERQLLDVVHDCTARLAQEALRTISGWAISDTLVIEGHPILCCHGSPYDFNDKLMPQATDRALSDRISLEHAVLICCGHTHMPGTFHVGGKSIVNAGSVGFSFDGDPRASYAILDITGRSVRTRMRRLDYDRSHYAEQLDRMSATLPLFASISHAVRTGTPFSGWKR
jgi:putative phosphoesterase